MTWSNYISSIRSRELPNEIQEVARRKLRMLANEQDVNHFRIPPANRLEKLKAKLEDYYSIQIKNQWRILFQ